MLHRSTLVTVPNKHGAVLGHVTPLNEMLDVHTTPLHDVAMEEAPRGSSTPTATGPFANASCMPVVVVNIEAAVYDRLHQLEMQNCSSRMFFRR